MLFVGGFAGCRRIAALAEAHGRTWSPHTWSNGVGLVANLHGALGCSTEPWVEVPYDPPAWSPERRDWLLEHAARDRRRRHDSPARTGPASGSSSTSTDSSAGASEMVTQREHANRAAVLARARATSGSRRSSSTPPQAGEVLVRVAAAGVCHSDLHFANGALGDGRWPMVLGHEGGGGRRGGRRGRHARRGRATASRSASSRRAASAGRAGPGGSISASRPARTAFAGRCMDGTSRLRLPTGRASSTGSDRVLRRARRRRGGRRRAAAATSCRSGRRRSSAAPS